MSTSCARYWAPAEANPEKIVVQKRAGNTGPLFFGARHYPTLQKRSVVSAMGHFGDKDPVEDPG
jgi:hypothetical protein